MQSSENDIFSIQPFRRPLLYPVELRALSIASRLAISIRTRATVSFPVGESKARIADTRASHWAHATLSRAAASARVSPAIGLSDKELSVHAGRVSASREPRLRLSLLALPDHVANRRSIASRCRGELHGSDRNERRAQ